MDPEPESRFYWVVMGTEYSGREKKKKEKETLVSVGVGFKIHLGGQSCTSQRPCIALWGVAVHATSVFTGGKNTLSMEGA